MMNLRSTGWQNILVNCLPRNLRIQRLQNHSIDYVFVCLKVFSPRPSNTQILNRCVQAILRVFQGFRLEITYTDLIVRKQPFFLIGLRIKMGDCHGPCPRNDIRDSFCNGIKATFCNDIRASFCNGIQYIFCNDFVSFLKLGFRCESWSDTELSF